MSNARTASTPATAAPSMHVTNSTISVGAFTPTDGHCDAVAALARALEANAQAVSALARALTPPEMPNATGIIFNG